MNQEPKEITSAVDILKANLMQVARVTEWAHLMGYKDPKFFSRKFNRNYGIRPQKKLEAVRLSSIIKQLRNKNKSNFEIAREHGISDEVALNKFTNYHLKCSPTELEQMSEKRLKKIMEKFGSKVW